MGKQSFESIYSSAVKALVNNHLLECFSMMKKFKNYFFALPYFNDDLDCSFDDYNRMLAFMKMGIIDPKRNDVYLNLCQKANVLIEKAARQYMLDNCHNVYVSAYEESKAATNEHGINNVMDEVLWLKGNRNCMDYYKKLDLLFSCIFSADIYKGNEAKCLQECIEKLPENDQATLVSAIMLNGLQFFDARKFELLLHFCASISTKVRIRSLTGVIFIYIRFEKRFHFYPELAKELSLILQNKQILEELKIMQRQLYISQQTKNAEYKIRNEIMPDLNKNILKQRNKLGIDQLQEDVDKMLHGEPNEEWGEIFNSKKFESNVKQIIDMGEKGIDINMTTFSAFKHAPFFQTFCHWLIPFDPKRVEISSLFPNNEKGNMFQNIIYAGNFCDSDIYSLCLMFCQINRQQSQMMIDQLTTLMNSCKTENIKSYSEPANECRRFFQDLYRIYKIYPFITGLYDPFEHEILFTNFPILSQSLKSSVYLHEMSSFLIRYHYYNEAISYIEELMKKEPANVEQLQKVAYCYQQTNSLNKAIYYYQQADSLNPNNEWVLKQMRLCYSSLGNYDKELKCLDILEQIKQGNTHLAFEKGFCLMQLKRYDEAAKIFYELEYKEKNVLQAQRAIAWCNFKLGRLEQAEKYYNKILKDRKSSWEDYLNAGHTAWCLNKIKDAINYYGKYKTIYATKHKGKSAIIPFDEDRNELIAHDIPPINIDLMHDIISSQP